MPNDETAVWTARKASRTVYSGTSAFACVAVAILPQDMLAIVKEEIEDTSHVNSVQKLTLLELQAMMMIFESAPDVEKSLGRQFRKDGDTYEEVLPKLILLRFRLI